jgi:hypothetical protein
MSDVIPDVTIAVLQAFADAWNRHDVDALMSFMTDDCVFEASAGPDVNGSRYAGRDAVRAGEVCPSGPSPAHEPMALAWKSTGVICLRFEMARSPSRTPTARIALR